MKKFVLGLFLILLVSGCAGMPDIFKGIIPGTGSNVNKTELSSDLIVIQNINVIPTPPIFAGDEFTVSFEIKNQDDINDVTTTWELFDMGLCKNKSSQSSTVDTKDFFPLQTELVEWSFDAPGNDEIASLPNKCPIRFKVNYTFNATSQIDVNIISKDRLSQLQKAGTPPSFIPNLVIGRGPVKIDLSFGATLPARNESSLPMFITVEDKGTGLLGVIPTNSLSIAVPSNFSSVSCGDRFICSGNVCTNNVTIPMIKKSSPQLRCSLTTPTSTAINNIERTYFITASLEYGYEITGESVIDIKPTST